MKIDLTNLSYDPRWYDFETGEQISEASPDRPCLRIRPYPSSLIKTVISDDGMIISGEERFKIFDYCLCGWNQQITDANGRLLPCSQDIKKKIFDFRLGGIADFVLLKSRQFEQIKEDQEKNS